MDRVIVVDRLEKRFEIIEREKGVFGALSSVLNPHKRTVSALREISFSVAEGELVGFIGPNGAGKTTTLKILSGILYPSSGFVQVNGFTPWERKNRFLKDISLVMGQKNQLWWDLPASETMELNKAIYEVPDKVYKKSLAELVRLLDVGEYINVPVRRLSLGQRMRLELVAALVHRPKIIFLDEPTIGLDVIAQKSLRDFISSYNRRYKATILLTSHNMDDVSSLARRVIVVNEGVIVFDGKLNELVSRYAKNKIIKIFAGGGMDLEKLKKIGKVEKVSLPEITLSIPRSVSKMAAAELLRSFPVDDLTIEEEPIEDVIRKVFSE